jgi:predicted amidohydrolase
MKIAVVQSRAVSGDIGANVVSHLEMADLAVAHGARFIAFPELSLTGYEPRLARELAIDLEDPRLDPFQQASDEHGICIAVGVPTRTEGKPRISLVLVHPRAPRSVYSKQFLHADEKPCFAPGPRTPGVLDTTPRIGLAICYELSVPEHAEATFKSGAEIYLASVAKPEPGVQASDPRLAGIAQEFGAPVLLANCVGTYDGAYCAGSSAVWNRRGERLARLDDTAEGLIVFDTESEEAVAVNGLHWAHRR